MIPAISIRFGAFFGRSEDFWRGIAVGCDFRALREEKAKLTAKIRTAEELVGGEGEFRRSKEPLTVVWQNWSVGRDASKMSGFFAKLSG
jgi:hypothetical protein